jgi:hypothetical protein
MATMERGYRYYWYVNGLYTHVYLLPGEYPSVSHWCGHGYYLYLSGI